MPIDLVEWAEFMTPTEMRSEVQVVEPTRALYFELLERGTNVVVAGADGSRSQLHVDNNFILQWADFSPMGVIYSTTDALSEGGVRIWRWRTDGKQPELLWKSGSGWESDREIVQGNSVYFARFKEGRSCISAIDVGSSASGTKLKDVTCIKGASRAWGLTAAQDGSISYLVSETGGANACADLFKISGDQEATEVQEVPCANRGWADETYAAWTDPPPNAAGGADWADLDLHANDGIRQVDLGKSSGPATRCGDRLAWRALGTGSRDELRIWQPARGVTVAYQAPEHDGSASGMIGTIHCVGSAFGFLMFDAGTGLSTFYTEGSLGWYLNGP